MLYMGITEKQHLTNYHNTTNQSQQPPEHVDAYNKLIIKEDFVHSVG